MSTPGLVCCLMMLQPTDSLDSVFSCGGRARGEQVTSKAFPEDIKTAPIVQLKSVLVPDSGILNQESLFLRLMS